jgi:hypothetical protein
MKNLILILLLLLSACQPPCPPVENKICPDTSGMYKIKKPCPDCIPETVFVPGATVYDTVIFNNYDTILKIDTIIKPCPPDLPPGPPETSNDTIKILYAETFDGWTTNSFLNEDSLERKMDFIGYMNNQNQSIVKEADRHGNVWQAKISDWHKYPNNCWNSFSIKIPLNYRSNDIWMHREIFVPTSFNPLGVTNQDRHVPPAFKLTGGFLATDNEYFYNHSGEKIDTNGVNARAGEAHSVGTGWITGEAFNMGYFWFQGSLANKEWMNGYCDASFGYYQINVGKWLKVDEHIILNTPGQYDGEYQEFLNGVCVVSYKGLKFRSKQQGQRLQVEAIVLYYFVGGNQTTDYAANMDLIEKTDNIVAYEYQPGAVNYNRRNIKIGDRIPIIPDPVKQIRPEPLLKDEVFTTPSGVFYDVGRPDIWNPPNKRGYIIKEVRIPTGTINYAFDVPDHLPQWGFPPDVPDQDCWVEVYSGTGANMKLQHTFGRTSRNGFPPFEDPGLNVYNTGTSTATFKIWIGYRGGDSRGVAGRWFTKY